MRSGVATELAQQISSRASRLGAGPDLKADPIEFTTASAAPQPSALGRLLSLAETGGEVRCTEVLKDQLAHLGQ